MTKGLSRDHQTEQTLLAQRRFNLQIFLAMPWKRQPTHDEIESLANDFRPLWRSGDVVRAWLRLNAETLKALIASGWSWNGIAAALTEAGITYRTKRPWSANTLKAEVSRATAPSKRVLSAQEHATPNLLTTLSLSAAQSMSTDVTSDRSKTPLPIPKFGPASLRPYEPPPAQTPEEQQTTESVRTRMFK